MNSKMSWKIFSQKTAFKVVKQLIKHAPNLLSILRIIFSVSLLLLLNSQPVFILIYLIIGLTDILDGFLARKLNLESEYGAKLDSAADLIFYIIIFYILVELYSSIFSTKLIIATTLIIFVRLLNMLLTKLKYKKIVFLHTIANKISGFLIYFLPLIIFFNPDYILIWIILFFVFLAALEELLITFKYSEVDLNRKGFF